MAERFVLTRHDSLVTIGLFIVAVLTRVPFRSQMLYHWDSVNFALATEHFDLRISQPHAPGYLLYVLAGRTLTALTHDPNAAYVWLSVMFSGLTVAILYLSGRDLFGRQAGLAAALMGLTSPSVWFYGEVALTYIVEAGLVMMLVFACYRQMRFPSLRWAVAVSLLMGITGGVRQTTLVLMLPLWLVTIWRTAWRVRVLSIALLVITILTWLVPTVALTGGPNVYLEVSRSMGVGVLEMFNRGDSGGIFAAVARVSLYLFYGLLGGGLAGLGWIVIKAIRSIRSPNLLCCVQNKLLAASHSLRQDARTQVFALWLIPSLLLWAPLARAPGHLFVFLPALILITGLGLIKWGKDLAWAKYMPTDYWLLAIIVVTNVLFFLAAPPTLFDPSQARLRRVAFTIPGRNTLVTRDASLMARIDYIRTHFSPETTAILAVGVDFRHPDYYLREYPLVREGQEGQPNMVAQIQALPKTIEKLVLFGDDASALNILNRGTASDVREVALTNNTVLRYLVRGLNGDFAIPGS